MHPDVSAGIDGTLPPQCTYLVNYGFNQDGSCFALATTTGFRTFTLAGSAVAEISRRTLTDGSEADSGVAVSLAVMLFQTNYVALVLKNQPYRVLLWDDSLRQKPHEIWSRYEILNVLLRRDVLVVVSEYRIYVYEFGSFQVLMHLATPTANQRGVAALSVGGGSRWVLVAPVGVGVVKLQTGVDQSAEIQAHNHVVAAVAVNPEGNLVATASEQGTVIKVFSATELRQLFAFRRGTTNSIISSLAFRAADSKFLAVASASSNTVHVFRLGVDGGGGSEVEEGVGAAAMAAAKAAAAGLARGYFSAERSFCQFRLPDVDNHGRPQVDLRLSGGGQGSAILGPTATFGKNNKLYVLHYNGVLYEGELETGEQQEVAFSRMQVVFAARPDFTVEQFREEEEGAWQVV